MIQLDLLQLSVSPIYSQYDTDFNVIFMVQTQPRGGSKDHVLDYHVLDFFLTLNRTPRSPAETELLR